METTLYLQPKEDKMIFIPHAGALMLNLRTDQVWVAVKKFRSGFEEDDTGLIGYGLRLEGDTSPNAYCVDYKLILNYFNVVSEGEVIPPISTKHALDTMVRDASITPTII